MNRKFTLVVIITYFLCNLGFAQDDTLKVIDSTGEIGSIENIVPIHLNNVQIVQGIQLTLHFDNHLEFVTVYTTDRTEDFNVYENLNENTGILKIILISLAGEKIFPGTGTILNVSFDVSESAEPGNYPLVLTDVVASNSFYESIPITAVDGVFTIEGGVIPVELASFTAIYVPAQKSVHLDWKTCSEKNNYGFEIQRGETRDRFHKIGFVKGSGTCNTPKIYSFIDQNVLTGKIYYRLKQIDYDGGFEFSQIIEVNVDAPENYVLSQNYPNPFSVKKTNSQTIIQFELPKEDKVEIIIYDILGRRVRTLVAKIFSQGIHRLNWDGKDEYGKMVSAGIYYYQMKTQTFNAVKKMLIFE